MENFREKALISKKVPPEKFARFEFSKPIQTNFRVITGRQKRTFISDNIGLTGNVVYRLTNSVSFERLCNDK